MAERHKWKQFKVWPVIVIANESLQPALPIKRPPCKKAFKSVAAFTCSSESSLGKSVESTAGLTVHVEPERDDVHKRDDVHERDDEHELVKEMMYITNSL